MLARLDSTNLNITWELENICDRSMNPVRGVYSFAGTATDANPDGWSFNRAMLFTGNSSGTFSFGELAVTLGPNAPVVANFATNLPTKSAKSPTAPPALPESRGPKALPEKNNVSPVAGASEPGGALWVILTGLIGIIGLLIWGIVIVKRLSRNALLAQESQALTARMLGDEVDATSPEAWRQRALSAEALAAKQT